MRPEPFPGTLQKSPGRYNVPTYTLSMEQEEWLRRWFPEVENRRLMKVSGMTHATLHRFARHYGLTKSEKGLKGIKRRQAAHIKRVCERSGYYDSMRGKVPSAAAMEGTLRMWQEIRDGIREHPVVAMKRKNPRKYRQWMRRKSEQRREAIRKDTLRAKWGLPRKTRLKAVVMCKYTKSQTSHRYNAQRRGYILAADCSEGSGDRYKIFYDDNTFRTMLFERNCMKDGFKIERWEE